MAFLVAGSLTLRDYAGTPAVVRVDGRRVSPRLIMLVANNIQLYGVFLRMAPSAVLDDGLLDVYFFPGRGAVRTLLHWGRLLISRHLDDPEVEMYRAQHIEIKTAHPLPVHVDGEPIGYTPVVIEVIPRALRLMIPLSAPATLFSDAAQHREPQTAWQRVMRRAKDAQSMLKEKSGPR
jgi:diacylglycerol kinase family enzyme